MRVQSGSLDVGRFVVMQVNMQTDEAMITRYWDDYSQALKDCEEAWYKNKNMGFVFLVLEVQGKLHAQLNPHITTKLTEKL